MTPRGKVTAAGAKIVAMLPELRVQVSPHVAHVNVENPTRAELLAWALGAMVPEPNWRHQAQSDAIADVGRLFALVMCGCRFERVPAHDSLTLRCVRVYSRGPDYFAGAGPGCENFWLPDPSLLVEQPNGDWYCTRETGGATRSPATP